MIDSNRQCSQLDQLKVSIKENHSEYVQIRTENQNSEITMTLNQVLLRKLLTKVYIVDTYNMKLMLLQIMNLSILLMFSFSLLEFAILQELIISLYMFLNERNSCMVPLWLWMMSEYMSNKKFWFVHFIWVANVAFVLNCLYISINGTGQIFNDVPGILVCFKSFIHHDQVI